MQKAMDITSWSQEGRSSNTLPFKVIHKRAWAAWRAAWWAAVGCMVGCMVDWPELDVGAFATELAPHGLREKQPCTQWAFELLYYRTGIRDVFWLGPAVPKVLGAKHISNPRVCPILIHNVWFADLAPRHDEGGVPRVRHRQA